VEPLKLRAHVDAELRIKVRQRLVHQKDVGIADDRPGDRDPLALPAGHLVGHPIEHSLQFDDLRGLVDPLVDLLFLVVAEAEAEGDVLVNVHVREQRDVLEDHRDPAVLRRQVRHVPLADADGALRGHRQPRDGLHRRRLAAPRRAHESDELPVVDVEGHIVDGRYVVVPFGDVFKLYSCHSVTP
jgi:hypothetical protein